MSEGSDEMYDVLVELIIIVRDMGEVEVEEF